MLTKVLLRHTPSFFIVLGAVAVALQLAALLNSGIGWDARTDAGQSLLIRDVVPNLPNGSTLAEAYNRVYLTAEFYGILIPQLADLLHFLISGSTELLQLNDIATYKLQGASSIGVCAAAAASLGYVMGCTLKSRLAGSYTWGLLMMTPVYFGMSYVNIKDAPVAAGFTFVASGIMLNRSGERSAIRVGVASTMWVAGACIGLATRPGLWPVFLLFSLSALGVFFLSDAHERTPRRSLPGLVGFLLALLSGLLLLWWSNPFGRMALFQWLYDSFIVMSNYPWIGTIRTAGQDPLSTELPWWYSPAWILAQMPLLTALMVFTALVLLVAGVFRRPWSLPRWQLLLVTPLVLQSLLIPLAIVATGAVLYDGARHLLFVVPGLVALTSLVIARMERAPFPSRFKPGVAATVVAVTVVVGSSLATLRWIPYSYAFINPIAGWNHPQQDWELDYWGVTAMEGVDRLESAGLNLVAVLPTEETATLFGGGSLTNVVQAAEGDGFGLYVFYRWGASIGSCRSLFTISRDGQVLGEGASCTREDVEALLP